MRITDNQGNLGEDSFILVRPAGIQVGVSGGAQRSMIDRLVITFAQTQTLNAGWYNFERLSSGPLPTVTPTIVNSNGMTTATLAFSGPGTELFTNSLTDGIYRLTLNSFFIRNGANQEFDGDANGAPGGNFLFPFHRLFGDGNGDATTDGNDFGGFGTSFGSSSPGAAFTAAYDYNEDGTINGDDFGEFGNRFGRTL